MNTLFFFLGLGIGAIGMFWIITSNYKLVKETSDEEPETEEPEDENEENVVDEEFDTETSYSYESYYIKFPHQARPIEVDLEEKPEAGHNILYRNQLYEITTVIHRVDGHTVFGAELKLKNNGN